MNQPAARPPVQPDCAEDLLILERRATLSEPEQRRLHMCLAASDSLQLLRQVGHAFDATSVDFPGDAAITEQLVADISARFAAPAAAAASRKSRKAAVAFLVATVLLTLGAAAELLPLRKLAGDVLASRQSTIAARPSHTQLELARSPSARMVASETQPAVSAPAQTFISESPAAVAEGNAVAHVATNARDAATTKAQPLALSAAELFSSANTLRRQGQMLQAAATYRQLQQKFPHSDEAALSYVLLARLDLDRGAAHQALREFEEYLRQFPSGSLEQEALQGKAQAFGRIGRTLEQRAVLSELLARYPNSVYAPSAQEQLGDHR